MAKEIVPHDLPKVKNLVSEILGAVDYAKIERLGGLTNHTYHVCLNDGKEYVVRIPGEGTEQLIARDNEKISNELACNLGIDTELLFFGSDGAKVTQYVTNAVTMCAESMRQENHRKQAVDIFKKLHTSGVNTGVPFEVFDMAAGYEKIIEDFHTSLYQDYQATKRQIMGIKQEIDASCDTTRVPCHNDPLCENWVEGDGRMYLIDWEYAGMNDRMWDLADISIEACYDHAQDEMFLTDYFGTKPDDKTWKHFLANKIYVDFLWTLWAKTRVPFDGLAMEQWAEERYARLKTNIEFYKSV